MITKAQMMPMVLDRCPAFEPAWSKHREFWEGEEAGIFNDLGELATFVVNAYERGDLGLVSTAFALVEEFLADGDEEVRNAAGIGFLEDIRNIASWRSFGSSVFVERLGPLSKQAWGQIEEIWRGKRSLADVVRAELAAEKQKNS